MSRSIGVTYLLDGCPGLRDLVDGIEANKNEFPAHTNVTFWGDGGDGVTNIQRNVLMALHQIFVADRATNNFKHVVFDRVFVGKPITAAASCPANEDHCKHLIQVDAAKDASHNTMRSDPTNGVATDVFDTWNNWQLPAPGY